MIRLKQLALLLLYISPSDSSVRRTQHEKDENNNNAAPSIASSEKVPSTIRKDHVKPRRDQFASPNPASLEMEFFDWCHTVMGIETSLEVRVFDYYDFFRVSLEYVEPEEGEESFGMESDDDAFYSPSVEDVPRIKVRGLAATKDVAIGDVVISIPFHAMITVSTTIDHDPVLSQLLGPQARKQYGWEDNAELPLLTVAILYHLQLGRSSPLHHYLQILKSSPTNEMPFLWDSTRLRQDATEGVARIARGIKRDVREMYKQVMERLMEQHPNVFQKGSDSYSFEKFQWAFAMVNSRHWQLPVKELDQQQEHATTRDHGVASSEHEVISPMVAVGVPPAETPTEEWVRELDDENVEENSNSNKEATIPPQQHSFLAPIADLLNFGPPCIRGSYNSETKRFELIATCPYKKGQEVTYWYSDDCEDAMIANYGFTHPMVPRCMSRQDWIHQSDLWKRHAEALEADLNEVYHEVDRLDAELKHTQAVLDKCGDCDMDKDAKIQREIQNVESRYTRQARRGGHDSGVRGSGHHHLSSSSEDRRKRRRWRSINSSL